MDTDKSYDDDDDKCDDGRRLTTSKLDLARLVVHRILVENHVARQGQRQLAVEDRAVRREANEAVRHGDGVEQAVLEVADEHVRGPEAVRHGDGVEQAVLEVADEHVRGPHAVELAMVQRHAATAVILVKSGERQTLVAPDLTQVQRRRVLLVHTTTGTEQNQPQQVAQLSPRDPRDALCRLKCC